MTKDAITLAVEARNSEPNSALSDSTAGLRLEASHGTDHAPADDMVPRSRLRAMERELQEAADKLARVQQTAGDEIRRLMAAQPAPQPDLAAPLREARDVLGRVDEWLAGWASAKPYRNVVAGAIARIDAVLPRSNQEQA